MHRNRCVRERRVTVGAQRDQLRDDVRAEPVALAERPVHRQPLGMDSSRRCRPGAGRGRTPSVSRPQPPSRTCAARSSVKADSVEVTKRAEPSGCLHAPRPTARVTSRSASRAAGPPPFSTSDSPARRGLQPRFARTALARGLGGEPVRHPQGLAERAALGPDRQDRSRSQRATGRGRGLPGHHGVVRRHRVDPVAVMAAGQHALRQRRRAGQLEHVPQWHTRGYPDDHRARDGSGEVEQTVPGSPGRPVCP